MKSTPVPCEPRVLPRFRRFTSTPASLQERKVGLYELERQEQRGAPDRGLADAVQRTWPGHLGPFIGCAFSTGHLAMFSGPVAQLVSARRLS